MAIVPHSPRTAADEGRPAHGLGEQDVYGALLDFLVDEASGHEHGDDEAEEGHGDEAEVLHHPALLAQADAASQRPRDDHQQDETMMTARCGRGSSP